MISNMKKYSLTINKELINELKELSATKKYQTQNY